jgi:hypothetical protein
MSKASTRFDPLSLRERVGERVGVRVAKAKVTAVFENTLTLSPPQGERTLFVSAQR